MWAKKLIKWYHKNKRDLPWRKNPHPYNIWLSEIILQQTTVSQGTPYYLKFIKKYPTIFDLSKARENEVLKIWQGLGYYTRAVNLLKTARYISKYRNGIFPDKIDELKKLKGIGDYTASAIVSISYKVPTSVVDGNVYRLISRFFGLFTPINSSKAHKEFKKRADKLMINYDPSDFNQAMMEFGSIQCKSKNPICKNCIFIKDCYAFNNKCIDSLPVKNKLKKIKTRYFNYIIVQDLNGNFIINQRTRKDIWNKLYQFPLIESDENLELESLVSNKFLFELYSGELKNLKKINSKPIIHRLSHQKINITFWKLNVLKLTDYGIKVKNLKNFPVPIILEKFFNSKANFES